MKKTLLSALCALVLSTPTLASVNRPFFALTTKFEGYFSEKKTIYYYNYRSQKDCDDDGGFYTNDTCEFPTQDEVKVKKIKPMHFEVQVSTIGVNGRSCLFVGVAQPVASKVLLAKDKESGCDLTLKYRGDNEVSVDSTPQCSYFCGARVHLIIDKALRQ